MDLAQLLAELAKHKAADIVAALPRGNGTLFQTIFQQGFDTSEAKAAEKIEAADNARKEAEKKAKDATRELEDLKANPGKSPEVAALVDQHKRETADLVAKHQRELEERDNQVAQVWREARLADLSALLTNPPQELAEELGGKHLVPAYARVLIQDQALHGRIRRGKDGSLELLAEDGKTPLVDKSGKANMALLATELVKKADPTFVLVNGDRGPGVDNGGGGNGGAASFYEQLRKDAQGGQPAPTNQPQQNQAPAVPPTAAQRLGVTPPVV